MALRAGLLAAAAILVSRAASCGEMLYISHRGESLDAPENTMAAFRLAANRGADGFECDVWLTADKRVVCIHDDTTWRTSGYTTNLYVTASTLAELRALDVGSWKGAAYAGERIPTLEEALSLAHDGFLIYVEIKQNAASGIVPYIKAIIEAEPRAMPDRIVFISFSESAITAIRAALPDYHAYWLNWYGQPIVTWSPDLGSGRAYTLYGKTNLNDAAWCTPTTAGTRHFKVSVKLP